MLTPLHAWKTFYSLNKDVLLFDKQVEYTSLLDLAKLMFNIKIHGSLSLISFKKLVQVINHQLSIFLQGYLKILDLRISNTSCFITSQTSTTESRNGGADVYFSGGL